MHIARVGERLPRLQIQFWISRSFRPRNLANLRSKIRFWIRRKEHTLNLPLGRTITAERSFYHRAVGAWNSVTADTRSSPSLCTFKRSVKRELRGQTPYVK